MKSQKEQESLTKMIGSGKQLLIKLDPVPHALDSYPQPKEKIFLGFNITNIISNSMELISSKCVPQHSEEIAPFVKQMAFFGRPRSKTIRKLSKPVSVSYAMFLTSSY